MKNNYFSTFCFLNLFLFLSCLCYRFRQEYRLERKLANELSIDPERFSEENEELQLSNIIATTSQPCSRHHISRVVVLHNDKLETFHSDNNDLFQQEKEPLGATMACDFDNDSFWSGSLTWY
jgi:hypothetical protein